MADWDELKRLIEAGGYQVQPWQAQALIAENEALADHLRMFELIHGGRASELYHEISALRDEVRRLKILAGEDVPPLPEEFVGPLPERPYSRLRRKLQEQQKSAGGAGAAENCRCNEKLQVVQELRADLELVRAEGLGRPALERVQSRLKAAGAVLPAPEASGTTESAMLQGLCIALCLVEQEIAALGKGGGQNGSKAAETRASAGLEGGGHGGNSGGAENGLKTAETREIDGAEGGAE